VNPPVDTAAPSISCPADITTDVDQAPQVISYTTPTVSGGAVPVATNCSIASGSPLPAGTNDIICTATDAMQRRAQCVFHVTVTVVSKLAGTKFLAFGDSITWGETAQPVASSIHVYDPVNNYPVVLQGLLRERYAPQASDIAVVNGGEQGETAVGGEGRLVDEVRRQQPDVLLLMEGINDINGKASPTTMATSIRADIARAFQHGTRLVLVSTLLPEVPGRFRAYNPEGVADANDAIRDAVAREGGILVDSFAVFDPQKELLIGDDGLHPTAEGYRRLAETFLSAIEQNFQMRPDPPTSPLLHRAGLATGRPAPPRLLLSR
jgi:lysophospholipase L1-like esterase